VTRGSRSAKRLATLGAILGLAMARPARANGRFPAASQLVVDPGDPAHIAVVATSGLLETFDGGVSWSLLCEAGYFGTNGEDAALGVTSNGTLLAGLGHGLSVAKDPRGCNWGSRGLRSRTRRWPI